MTTTDPAVQAAAEAMRRWHQDDLAVYQDYAGPAAAAVAAARPHIAAEVRAEVAAAIRAEVDAHAPAGGIAAWRNNGLTAAARIAEGGTPQLPRKHGPGCACTPCVTAYGGTADD